ncbi:MULTISPECIES: hypothetical protein [unclassified Variovorax]|uniref:hypothetical protein n=1 Tax=unclassified Variovorax TaxID=663243 RepID=UPI0015A39FA5|nr:MULTISPECIES: hypothetical protein [unclassified Variovorax]
MAIATAIAKTEPTACTQAGASRRASTIAQVTKNHRIAGTPGKIANAYTYDGASTAWTRARERAKVKNAHFHDLRAKALTDIDGVIDRGIGQAQTMGGHSTQTQTADYVRHKRAKKTSATR